MSEELFQTLHETIRVKGSDIFLIGGLAMSYYGLKLATKDVDIVFLKENEAKKFIEDMKKQGFQSDPRIDNACSEANARKVIEFHGLRIDIFVTEICRGLSLSRGMVDRAVRIPDFKDVNIYAISREDIFLLKGITERTEDLMDMQRLANSQLEWDVIESEVRSQKDSWRWILKLYLRLLDLEEEYGIRSPLIKRFEKEADLYAGMTAVLSKYPDGKADIDAISEVLEGDRDYALRVLDEMRRRDLIRA
jgi:hypothetical protein